MDEANAKLDSRVLGLQPSVKRKVTGSISSQDTTDKVFFFFVVYYAKLHFTTCARTGLVHREIDANTKVQRVEVNTKVATLLGLLNVFGTPSSLMQAWMPKDPDLADEGLSMTLDYAWVTITHHEDLTDHQIAIQSPSRGVERRVGRFLSGHRGGT